MGRRISEPLLVLAFQSASIECCQGQFNVVHLSGGDVGEMGGLVWGSSAGHGQVPGRVHDLRATRRERRLHGALGQTGAN